MYGIDGEVVWMNIIYMLSIVLFKLFFYLFYVFIKFLFYYN